MWIITLYSGPIVHSFCLLQCFHISDSKLSQPENQQARQCLGRGEAITWLIYSAFLITQTPKLWPFHMHVSNGLAIWLLPLNQTAIPESFVCLSHTV